MQFGNHDGTLTEHDGNHFKSLLLDSYKEADIDPATVDFIEAYGSGIKSEDAMELNIMEEVFCTENRRTPLKVGSVKSNVGHCEVSSLFMSIFKAIITLESGYIPPNINYTGPNNNVAALKNGKIQVITEKTPFVGDIIGISSFGLLNAFSHVILKKNQIVNNIIVDKHNSTNIPQLILVSGRNEENVKEALNQIKSHGNNTEFVSLTNDVFTRNINGHFFRSFNIFPQSDESRIDDVWNVTLKRPVWFIFSGMGSQWQGMGTDLMKVPVFADAINKCDVILKPKGVDIKNILTSQNPKLFDNILNSFVGIAAVQIGLVEVLRALDITPDGIIGHSLGELGCAYADGCFTAEEMLLASYARGQATLKTELIPGMMAAIGLGYDQIKDKLPHAIDAACRNSATSCTISGPVESIKQFVSQLKSEGVFAKSVNVGGIAFHSRYIQSAGPTLLKYLKDVIKVPKKRSSKWLSSSLPETEWESDLAKYSSPEYHTNNLLSSVLFEDVLNHIPKDAITIEIAPHGLLQAIIERALPEMVTNIPLTKRMSGDSVRFLLTSIGKMYASGLNPKIKELYPTIKYPVSRGTPSIYGLTFWDHTEKWSVRILELVKSGEHIISLVIDDDKHLAQYQCQGQYIIPFSFLLFNVWKAFIEINSKSLYENSIQFQNLRFKNNVKIHPTDFSHCYIMIQLGSGLFECDVNNEVILSGEIRLLNNLVLGSNEEKSINFDNTTDNLLCNVSKNEIYSVLKNNGFNLGFKNITNLNIYKNNIQGSVEWENNWIYFLDCLFKFPFLENLGIGPIEIPVYIREMFINPALFENRSEKDISVNYNKLSNEVTCDGIKILGVKNAPISLPILNSVVVKVQEKSFTKFNNLKCKVQSNNITELSDLLFQKKNGVTIDSRRWKPNKLGALSGTGKIKNIDTFDSAFFRVHPKLAKVMDTMTKISLERSIEAIIDAGLSPADLYGTNTGVFMGSAISETEMKAMDTDSSLGFVMLGTSRAMQANRLSFILNLTGPSFSMDGGWICGANGLKKAKEMIENGLLPSAIVGVTNLTLRPDLQFLYQGLNRLNKSNQTKPFSSDADGYNRSEACIVLYLQKASEAKRSYGTLLNVKSMQFGNHDGTLTEHDGNHFKSLLLDSYKEADIDPATVDFIEAYGSGIKSEDAMELNIMEEVFCTENRKTPLKVGSVKSNVGHCEVSSLFMSIAKAIITLESGYIPPNINYTVPNNNVAALKNGKIQVITEKTPFVGDIIGISSFGLLNAFSHVILKKNQIVKNKIVEKHNSTNIPRLILVSGRNEENVRETLNQIKSHGNNAEFVSLTNDVFTRNIYGHLFRSFNIFPQMDESRIDDVRNISSKRPVWFIFSGMGSQWQGMGTRSYESSSFC
eukprot:XP_016657088.1 PREDICTED: fatty acid synthase-like [Acyrthosiphon pisum]